MGPNFNPQNILNAFQQFRGNPFQFLAQRKLNIPQELMGNPQAAIQHLMDSGQMSQGQFTQIQSMVSQMQRNPMFQAMFK